MFRLIPIWALFVVFGLASESENPGFFLKITKNVPRIGRRSGTATDFDSFYVKNVPRIGRRAQMEPSTDQWIRKIRSDTHPSSTPGYNYVQPFDMKFLFNLLADEPGFDESQLKFISWKDFDEAIEGDTQLFMKLIELGKEHRAEEFGRNEAMMDDKFVINSIGSGARRHGLDEIFYRTERNANGRAEAGAKEKVNK